MGMKKFRATPLPQPDMVYNVRQQLALIRTLERYFAQLDSDTPRYAESYEAKWFIGDASQMHRPYVQALATGPQAPDTPGTEQPIEFDSPLNAVRGVGLDSDVNLVFSTAGVYRVVVSAVFDNVSGGAKRVVLSVEKDPGTVTPMTFVDVADNTDVAVNTEIVVPVDAGGVLRVLWLSNHADCTLTSARVSVVQISAV